MNFKYKARNTNGEILEGYIEGEDQRTALNLLKNRGYIVINLKESTTKNLVPQKKGTSKLKHLLLSGTVPGKTLMIFFRQMATMIRAGLSVSSAIDLVTEQEKNYTFKNTLEDIKEKLDRGVPLSQAMSEHKVFTPLMVSLVEAGEEGGMLDTSLNETAVLLEKQQALKSKVKGAMFYPMFIILFAISISAVFFVFVVPKFRKVFTQMRIQLPALTQMMFQAGDWTVNNWQKLVIFAGAGLLILYWLFTSKQTKRMMDRVKLKTPIFSGLIFKSSMARVTRTLAALTTAGVPVMRGLEMAERSAVNSVIQEGFEHLRADVSRGVSLGDASKRAGIFPILVSQMMRIGEETGHLDNMLERVALWYDQELDEQIKITTSLMEPVMIVLVGGLVAVIAFSIFGPITSAISQMV